ncbi:MAG TPA: M56 family metallopeptidase [Chitinophagaceae bacterium]
MNNIMGQSNFLQALGWAVLNSLWQIALLWIVYQFITGVLKIKNPASKSSLASLLLFTGFVWFIFTFFSIFISESADAAIVSSGLINMEGNQQLNDWLDQTLPIASLLYLILLLLPLLHFIRNYRYVQVIRQYGLSKADVEWRMFVKKVAAQMGIKKPVHIWVSELVTSPVTIGYIKPIILVPLAAVNHLSTQQLEAVLLHELAHIRRYDYFINLILKFIQSILYFNPFVKAFVEIVEREREKSCDEMVIQFQYDPHGYASALLVMEKTNHLPKPLAVAAAGKKNDLLHRIEWIMGVQKKPVVSFNKLAGLLAGLLCIITLNALVILSKPSVASNSISSFSPVGSPFYFFTGDDEKAGEPMMMAENQTKEIETTAKQVQQGTAAADHSTKIKSKEPDPGEQIQALIHPFAMAVANFEQPEIPELKRYQEDQVKKAIDASKKVLQEGQWKTVEKNIAEVFTQQQKETLKAEYMKEMSKLDLDNWEQKLRTAYDKVDWETVNIQLANAVNNIRMDSLQYVYSKALNNLCVVQDQLKENKLTSIPDTDITLQLVEQKKHEVEKELNKLKAAKARKIVHL